MSYRQSPAYALAVRNASRERAAQRGTRGELQNVGRKSLSLRNRVMHTGEQS